MKILLAVDFSPGRNAVAGEIAARPWPAGTTVDVLSVVEPFEMWAVPELIAQVTRRTTEMVQQMADLLTAAGLAATPLVLTGDPKTVIVDQAKQSGADFVAVGSHGATGLARLLFGSVARAVLRHVHCSVEIVRSNSGQEPVRRAMKILLATDGSQYSGAAAHSIAERPWPAGTEVRILSVVEPRVSLFEAAFEPPLLDAETVEQFRVNAMKHAQDAIVSAEEILASAGVKTAESISVLLDGPKHVILDEAQQWGADLIVAGSQGRSGAGRFWLGSVSESVAMHAGCSVEVIRPPKTEGSTQA
jgi:nucleotide-binding universal stress UspA family protein